MAVGSTGTFLPLLIKQMESAKSGSTRVLYLHALKEVSHSEALPDSSG